MAHQPVTKQTWEKYRFRTTSGYGYRKGGFHRGVDIAPNLIYKAGILAKLVHIPVIAMMSGTLRTFTDKYGAKCCYITGTDGKGYFTAHHSSYIRTSGVVRAGEPIAYVGNTGKSTGPHVHYEIHKKANGGYTKANSLDPGTQGLIYLDTSSTIIINKFEMVQLQKQISVITTNTIPLRVRKQPSTESAIVDKVGGQVKFGTAKVARGEKIKGNETWYNYKNIGWVSGAYVKEL